jgi:hypothetical protein
MKVRRYEKGALLFVESEVMVLLDGQVFLKSHSDNVVPPVVQAKLGQGDVLGHAAVDNGVSNRTESWCIAQAPTEVAVFSPQDFEVKNSLQ